MFKRPQPPKAAQPAVEPVITPEADRELSRVLLIYGSIFIVLLTVTPWAMSYVNIPHTSLFTSRRFLDTVSILIVMIPFFLGASKMSAIRLRWGRLLVGERRWKEAVAALEPFATFGQRSYDGTGEAHYLLATALSQVGEPVKAERARAFVLKHRATGPWAERLRADDASRSRGISSVERVKTLATGETRVRVAKGKRRRF